MKLPMPFSNPTTYAGHSGIDFPVPRGTPIPASGAGRVTSRGWNSIGGFFIWVKYDVLSEPVGYHHMDSHAGCPTIGTRVAEGTRLGYVGNSGRSTGPHLHSEVANNRTTDGYWRFFDRNRSVGSAGGGTTSPASPEPKSEEDDMYTDDDRRRANAVYDAVFRGGNSMKDNGASISDSLARIAEATKPILYSGGKQVSVRQVIANIDARQQRLEASQAGLEAALKALAGAKGLDPQVILQAAQQGVENAMRNVTFTASVDG